MAQNPHEMLAAMVANMKEKTGKSLEEWKELLSVVGLEKHGQMVNHLKKEHGVTHGYANSIVHLYRDTLSVKPGGDGLLEAQYAGPKADLKPIYDQLISEIQKFGDDIELAPKKAYMSLRRKKQFALIQPSTKTRIDVGLSLKGHEITDRLEKYNAMCSHRVRVTGAEDIDQELIDWLKAAYESAG